jgi:hypothetical protein
VLVVVVRSTWHRLRCELQLLGLDYLVDAELHPWLLEVNGTPSLAVQHGDPVVEQLIGATKVKGLDTVPCQEEKVLCDVWAGQELPGDLKSRLRELQGIC